MQVTLPKYPLRFSPRKAQHHAVFGEVQAPDSRFSALQERAALSGRWLAKGHAGFVLRRGMHSIHFKGLETAEALLRYMEGATASTK